MILFSSDVEIGKHSQNLCSTHFEQSSKFQQKISMKVEQQSMGMIQMIIAAVLMVFMFSLYWKFRKRCSCFKKKYKDYQAKLFYPYKIINNVF